MKLKAGGSSEFALHPVGLFPAVCVDVIDLGLMTEESNGQSKTSHKIRIVWETSEKKQDGTQFTLSKRVTASLHPKARLTELLGKWRGKPVGQDEVIDLQKLIGANANVMVGHTSLRDGNVVATIDAVTKPTSKLQPSGKYDPAAARQKIVEKTGRPIPGFKTALPSSNDNPDAAEAVAEVAEEPVALGF